MEKQEYLKLAGNIFNRYKYVLLVAAVGVILLCWPSGNKREKTTENKEETHKQEQTVEGVEAKLEELLSMIEGVGEVRVMLTLSAGPESIYADEKTLSSDSGSAAGGTKTQSQGQYVVVKDAQGNESLVGLKTLYSRYRGALVVCAGADDASVRLAVTNAVRSVTGLGTDCITVEKMG